MEMEIITWKAEWRIYINSTIYRFQYWTINSTLGGRCFVTKWCDLKSSTWVFANMWIIYFIYLTNELVYLRTVANFLRTIRRVLQTVHLAPLSHTWNGPVQFLGYANLLVNHKREHVVRLRSSKIFQVQQIRIIYSCKLRWDSPTGTGHYTNISAIPERLRLTTPLSQRSVWTLSPLVSSVISPLKHTLRTRQVCR